ncbi:MAG: hypothetical protein EOM05_08705 [Clostridia bacterium]|nr:hypothetical protein [Clostridia bacterium]
MVIILSNNLSLRLIENELPKHKSLLSTPGEQIDPNIYQERIIQEYIKFGKRKNWAYKTIKNQETYIREIIDVSHKFIWELYEDDIDSYVDILIESQNSASYRRKKVSTFRSFYEWLIRNYYTEIKQLFNCSLLQPVTDDNQITHVYDLERENKTPPPSPEILTYFFDCFKRDLNLFARPEIAAREYVLFRLMYASGLRIDEAVHLDLIDINFSHGKLGMIHVRFGKGSRGSGKRERWVPMLTDIDKLLKWYLKYIRPRFKLASSTQALFLTQKGTRLTTTYAAQELERYQQLFEIPETYKWSTHKFRHAFATHNYESGMKLTTIKDLLGHVSIYTTLTYVSPSIEFVTDNIIKTNSKVKEYLKSKGGTPPWIATSYGN